MCAISSLVASIIPVLWFFGLHGANMLEAITKTKKWNEETKRFDYGNYPLYEIISSHVCRRSFATHNYAKIPTPIIMAVTGHKTEKEILNYIGKDYNDLSREMLTYWKKEKETAEPQQKNKTAN